MRSVFSFILASTLPARRPCSVKARRADLLVLPLSLPATLLYGRYSCTIYREMATPTNRKLQQPPEGTSF